MKRDVTPDRRTWDGLPVSPEPPYGAAVVVYRRCGSAVEYLLLHRSRHGAGSEGDWAWGPPSGARLPGEDIDFCARRELVEETGLGLPLRRVGDAGGTWAVYAAEAPPGARVRLSAEHDRCQWVSAAEAARRCRPPEVARQVLLVAGLVEGKWP